MKPVTALCLAALGFALMYPRKDSRLAFAVGFTVLIVAALDLSQVLFNLDLGIDRWLVPPDAVPEPWAVSFRVINGMPLALGLAGGSLALSRSDGHHFTATALAGLAGAMAVFALLTYSTGINTLYGPEATSPPALPSAAGMLCVVSGIILRIGAMPALRKPRPLWQLQIMLGCTIVAPLLLFGAYAGYRLADAQLRQVREDLAIEARTLSANVDREIIGEIERLQALTASLSLRQGDFAEFQRQAEAALGLPQSGNIVLIERNMQQLVNTRMPFGKPLPKAVVPKPIARSLATGKPQVTDLFMVPIVNQLLVGIIVPVQIDGESRYVVGRTPDQHALARLVAENELPTGWHAVVSDAAHRIISRSEQEGLFIGKELPPAQWRRTGPGDVFEFIDSEGRPSLEASATSELTGWETAVWAPKALLEAAVRAQWQTLGVMALLAFVLLVALASWLGRIIARSVGQAARAAIALGEGGPMPLSGTPVAEVDTLMAELRRAAARRQAAEDWLRESKERLQTALNVAQLGSYRYDPCHRVFSGDTRSQEIFDFPKNEATIEEIMKLVHPDDVEMVQANLEASLDPVDPKLSATELRLRRGDGQVRWVETLGLAYFEGAGDERRAVSFVGTLADITERKGREEKEQLLMREV